MDFYPSFCKVLNLRYAGKRSEQDQYLNLRNMFLDWLKTNPSRESDLSLIMEAMIGTMLEETEDGPFCSKEDVFLLRETQPF